MATLGLGNFSDVLASIMIHTSHDVCAPVSTFLCIELAHPSSHAWLSTSLKLLLICSIFPLLFTYEAFVYFLYSSLVVILQSSYFSSTFILFEAWCYFL
jgi:hypothetical protein